MIPLSKCIDGRLYRLQGRKFSLGVFLHDQAGGSFIGLTTDRGATGWWLDYEQHWEADVTHGTTWPTELLQLCPLPAADLNKHSEDLHTWLEEMREKYPPLGSG